MGILKIPRYTVSRCRKDDSLYGPKHGSEHCEYTLCRQEINMTWWIVDNDFNGGITCKKCLKILNGGKDNDSK
jgi:hypothetical protein